MKQQTGVVILSFNHPDITTRCVQSVLNIFSSSQVVLVHNGSISKNVDSLRKQFSEITHLVLPENRHFSGGANRGLSYLFKQFSFEYCLFLTNDTQLVDFNFGPQFSNLKGVFAPLILKRKTQMIDSIGGKVNLSTMRLAHLKNTDEFDQLKTTKREFFYVPGTAFLIDRTSFAQLGGYIESLQTYWEDVELSLRAKSVGVGLGILPSIKVQHSIGKTCHKLSEYTIYLFHRNKIIVSKAYLPYSISIVFYAIYQMLRLGIKLIIGKRWKDLLLLSRSFIHGFSKTLEPISKIELSV